MVWTDDGANNRHQRSSPGSGTLVAAVWLETADGHFRARITTNPNATGVTRNTIVVGSPDEVIHVVQEWIKRFTEPS